MDRKVNFKQISVHDAPKKSLGFLLWHLSTSWRSFIETVLQPLNLTHPQFVVLATVGWLTRKEDRVTQAAIGKMAALDPNTTSQIMRGLEKKNFIRREVSMDGRIKNPLLTAEGQAILKKAMPAVEKMDAEFFNSLTHQEQLNALQIFQKLARPKP